MPPANVETIYRELSRLTFERDLPMRRIPRSLHEQLEIMCDVVVRQLAQEIGDSVLPILRGIRGMDQMPGPDAMREIMRGIHERLCVEFGRRV